MAKASTDAVMPESSDETTVKVIASAPGLLPLIDTIPLSVAFRTASSLLPNARYTANGGKLASVSVPASKLSIDVPSEKVTVSSNASSVRGSPLM